MQLANAYATLANGGTRFSPNIVEAVVSREAETFGEAVLTFEPGVLDVVDFPEGSSVCGKVEQRHQLPMRGTAARAFEGYDHKGYPVSGKTGTAQAQGLNAVLRRKKEDTAVFVAWAPTHDPRYAVVVVMEEPDTAAWRQRQWLGASLRPCGPTSSAGPSRRLRSCRPSPSVPKCQRRCEAIRRSWAMCLKAARGASSCHGPTRPLTRTVTASPMWIRSTERSWAICPAAGWHCGRNETRRRVEVAS